MIEFICIWIGLIVVLVEGKEMARTYRGGTEFFSESFIPVKFFSETSNKQVTILKKYVTDIPSILHTFQPKDFGVESDYEITATDVNIEMLDVEFEQDCLDLYSFKLFSDMKCKLPSKCSLIGDVELDWTWYGSKVKLCYGSTGDVKSKLSKDKFKVYSNSFKGVYEKMNDRYGIWVRAMPGYKWARKILNTNYELVEDRPEAKDVVKFAYSTWADRFGKYNILKHIELTPDWQQAKIHQYTTVLNVQKYLFGNNKSYDNPENDPALCYFTGRLNYPSLDRFKFICTDDVNKTFDNKKYKNYTVFYSPICRNWIAYNTTHSVCYDIFTKKNTSELCPIYYLPIRNSVLKIPKKHIFTLNVRTNNEDTTVAFINFLQGLIFDSIADVSKTINAIVEKFSDHLIQLIKTQIPKFVDIISKLLREVIEEVVNSLKIIFQNLLGTKIGYDSLFDLIGNLVIGALHLIIIIILGLDTKFYLFETIIVYLALRRFYRAFNSFIIILIILCITGIERHYSSVLNYLVDIVNLHEIKFSRPSIVNYSNASTSLMRLN